VRFVLKDGTEIHRIDPPRQVSDCDTCKSLGRPRPEVRSARAAIASTPVAAKVVPRRKTEVLVILDFEVEPGRPKKQDRVKILDL
jgi:hypothetical protein